MCGICGISSEAGREDLKSVVAAMSQALYHRGPDDGGQFDAPQASIAMRRLSIIDLATGQQPIANEDQTLRIVFNGEIYNYRDLRQQLLASGRHRFTTSSDTEVILHLYEEHGLQTPALLHGMFTFCIHDRRDDSLFIARDRFGEKPLYYSVSGPRTFAFSSELASLLEFSAIDRKLSAEALYYYLHVGYLPSPLTMFSGVRELPAGHWLRWRQGRLETGAYYQPEYRPDPALRHEAEAVAAVRDTLLRAVKRQMVSDVPLGAFLSGGIDSSSVVAAMQRQTGQKIKTFTVRFEYAPYDESEIARQVAQHLGTDHHEFVVTNGGFNSEDLWRIIRHVGQPFVDSSAIPTYFLSRFVRDHVKVSLSGDGGDEMFAGYSFFQDALKVDRLASAMPRALLATAGSVLQRVAELPGTRQMPTLRKLTRAAYAAAMPERERTWALGPLFEESELDGLVTPQVRDAWQQRKTDAVDELLGDHDGISRLRQLMNCRLKYFLASDMLVKVDRMSMAASLEVRAPMLDVELAELAMKLPDHLLIKEGTAKYILRQAVRDWLPASVFSHPKQGFSIPLHMFQNEQYRRLCEELLLGDGLPLLNRIFSKEALHSLIRRGFERRFDAADISVYRASHQVWALLHLAAWMKYFRVEA